MARTSTAHQELLHKLAAEAYAWMERQYGPEAGRQKLTEAVRYVMDRLHLEKIGLSVEDVTAAVQKAWQELEAQKPGDGLMGKGFDAATKLTADKAREFAAQGFIFVGRYLDSPTSRKVLTAQEARHITDAGMYIVSFYERWASRVREGAEAGAIDGRHALALARQVGQPEGSTIYPAMDYDAPVSDYDRIEDYLRAFDAEIEGYEVGCTARMPSVKPCMGGALPVN